MLTWLKRSWKFLFGTAVVFFGGLWIRLKLKTLTGAAGAAPSSAPAGLPPATPEVVTPVVIAETESAAARKTATATAASTVSSLQDAGAVQDDAARLAALADLAKRQ